MAIGDFSPRRWHPPEPPPPTGPYAPNTRLRRARRWEVPAPGPEDVAVVATGDHAGVYTGTADGTLWRLEFDDGAPAPFATVVGRPLGIEVLDDGALVVCAADRGLVRVDLADGSQELLVDSVDGQPLVFTNNASVHPDGRIFFTDTSANHPIARFEDDLIEHAGTGRLCVWRPDGNTEVVLDGLQFANGVTLHPDGDVLVAETGSYRIQRVVVDGPDAGTSRVFVDNLPGFPDNLSTGPLGVVWVALASPRLANIDFLAPLPGWVKQAVVRLPHRFKPKAARHGYVLGVDAGGQVVANFQDPGGEVAHYVTGAREHDGRLYLGSLVEPAVVVVDLDPDDFATS